jgi:hypothetical protein
MPDTTITLPDAPPRDREVQAIVHELVAAFAFCEAASILNARLREIAEVQRTHIEALFLAWRDLPAEEREDFLIYAHHRRRQEIEHG